MPTHTLTRKPEKRGKDLIDQIDALHLRGALVAINVLLQKLPETKRLNASGRRACDKACDARNALRDLLEEHDAGRLTLAEFGGWEPLRIESGVAE
jgi:hypothetical protein